MAAGVIVVPSLFPARDRNGRLVAGALMEVRVDLTTTKADIYADSGLTTPLANPVTANSSGVFPLVWAEGGTEEAPVLYTIAVSGPGGVSIANPSVFSGWRPSVDADTANAALAFAAAAEATANAEQTAADLAAVQEIASGAPDAPSVLNKANIDAANISDVLWRSAIGLGSYKRPEDFDPAAGTGGNDTAALQAAIDAVKGRGPSGLALGCVLLSGKDYIHTGLVVDRPVEIQGVGGKASRLVLSASANKAAITIACAHDGHNYWLDGGAPAEVKLFGFSIIAPNRDAAPGQNVAHGIELKNATTNPIYTRVVLEDSVINGVPGDGISATGWSGLLEWRSGYIAYVGRNSVYANSVSDWRFSTGDVFGAKKDNFLFSGSVAMQLSGVNCYVALENNINCFGSSSVVADGCYFDLAEQHNIRANLGAGGDLRLTDCTVRWASQQGDNLYSDLYIDPSPQGGRVFLKDVKFANAKLNGFGPRGPKFNIEFANPTIAQVRMPGVIFSADDDTDPTRGPLARARISNDMRRIRATRGEIPSATVAQLRSASDLVNTVNKRAGAQVFDADNNRYVAAIGGTPTSGWYSAGTLVINVDLP